MKQILPFQIECGATTCASGPGKFCRFLAPGVVGGGACYFFGMVYDDESGWIQRHPECLKLAASHERMIAECVPGGSICDPQQVADALRSWEP